MAVIDSGFGMVNYADALSRVRPDTELVLARDPDNMPYGLLEPARISECVVSMAASAVRYDVDAIIVACNTGSMYALEAARARFEPAIPVVGVVPAIRPAGATGRPFAVWATAAATVSEYQTSLIDAFADPALAHRIPCYGLAEAIDSGDPGLVTVAIAEAAALTPPEIESVVLGCTHYGLVEDEIVAALRERTGRDVAVFDSPEPVARQVLRRIGEEPGGPPELGAVIAVLESGRPGLLPEELAVYPAGRLLLDRCVRDAKNG
ncbi:glutamate racemase [Tsukamurella sp. 1534]|uniref:glutamate racemase n=1 Tax=Tsukamurella sp. 1534 TaxID=1151061 RepID=UPI0002DCE8AA|nr:aspartate/glutamate racemase family protein [Tsukamurella sp. 1534]